MKLEYGIQQPFGITVFGSAITRIAPDIASLEFAVTRLAQHPREAFHEAHEGARNVRKYLEEAGITEVSMSRVILSQSFRYVGNENRFLGYTAKVEFHVLLHDLARMEDLLSGVVDAGANEVSTVDFQTSQLKELREEARQRAVKAAREKAENYCAAAGVALGPIIHIEDVNPDVLHQAAHSQIARDIEPDDTPPLQTFDPGSIEIGGAVRLAFEIAH